VVLLSLRAQCTARAPPPPEASPSPAQDGFIGIIQKECKPAVVCKHAIEDATHVCEATMG
jgi:hypothetical protein